MSYLPGTRDPRFIAGEARAGKVLDAPERAFRMLREEVPWEADRESSWLVLVDTKHRVLRIEMVSMGSLGNTFMASREILRTVLRSDAAAFLVAHNHPSGDPEPSGDDLKVTRQLKRASEAVGVELLDHLVLGAPVTEAWVSLARRGAV